MRLTFRFISFVVAGVAIVWASAGCQDRSDAPKVQHLKGRVTKIDPESGLVSGLFWVEKQKGEMELTGKLAPDAEIMINGRTATLADVRIDDAVEVTGWEEKRSGDRRLIAKKVEITRPTAETQAASGTRPTGS